MTPLKSFSRREALRGTALAAAAPFIPNTIVRLAPETVKKMKRKGNKENKGLKTKRTNKVSE